MSFLFGNAKGSEAKRKPSPARQDNHDPEAARVAEALRQHMARQKSKSDARKQAEEEEKAYVDYRKQQVLATIKPRVATLQTGDDVFPKPKRAMGFGERKAYYLSKRPNPKFATWIGRNTTKTPLTPVVPSNCVPRDVEVTDHSTVPVPEAAKTPTPASADPTPTKAPAAESTKATDPKKDAPVHSEKHVEKSTKAHQGPTKGAKYGNRADNPIGKSGRPFWVEEGKDENSDTSDEDLCIDLEMVERVGSGEIKLEMPPYVKKHFDPYGAIREMKRDDKLFDREKYIFANTVRTVTTFLSDDLKSAASQAPTPTNQQHQQRKVKWANTITVTKFDPDNRQPREEKKSTSEPLKDIVRKK